MKAIVYALMPLCIPAAFGQARPISTGDMLTFKIIQATGVGKFDGSETIVMRRTEIDNDGTRKYFNENGASSVFDKYFAMTQTVQGARIASEAQFPYLPKEMQTKLEPGSNWVVRFSDYNKGCQSNVNYIFDAVASVGPERQVEIDGVMTTVPTIAIDYKATPVAMPTCPKWTMNYKVYYAPSLGELVEIFYENYRGADFKEGNTRKLLSVKTARAPSTRQ
jgi:hypothetical protein